MSRQAGAVARRAGGQRLAPRSPRRLSGPATAPRRAHGGAVARPPLVDRGLGLGRVRALPDSSLLDKLLRSRAWIWLIGLALGGIVAMQVSLLKLNHGISRAVESAATLERQNAGLESEIARLSSGERIRAVAARAGMVMPEAGSVAYLSVREGDARRAAARMQEPSEAARTLMQGGGIAAPTTVAAAGETAVTPAAAADPATTAAPETETAAPAPTATPAPPPTGVPATTATGGAASAGG